ncbi:anthranilate phosphoribosyltransferase, partial [filamentous cyanobacterium CCP5]
MTQTAPSTDWSQQLQQLIDGQSLAVSQAEALMGGWL